MIWMKFKLTLPFLILPGDLMKGVITCCKHQDSHRCLKVTVSVEVHSFDAAAAEQPCKVKQTYILT